MSLYIRISDTDLCFARYEAVAASDFHFEPYRVTPQASLTVNLRSAMQQVDLLNMPTDRVEVLVEAPVTPVPLAVFQEEDAEALYHACFEKKGPLRVFYDTVPAVNAVFLFSLPEATCRTLDEAFQGRVRYTTTLASVVHVFAGKGLAATGGRRLFVYVHDGVSDVVLLEGNRLLMLNTYNVQAPTDVCYYTFNMVRHLGLEPAGQPIYVAGEDALLDPVVDHFQHYAPEVYAINPAADFNRHIVATTEGVPYDLMCHLLKRSAQH